MITKLETFLENKAIEKLNEANIFYSDRLRLALEYLEQDSDSAADIASELIAAEGRDLGTDTTLIDFDSKTGYFAFSTERHLIKRLQDIRNIPEEVAKTVAKSNTVKTVYSMLGDEFPTVRQSVKYGKLVNSLFPGKFTDKEVEQFVNKVKSNLEVEGEKMSLVDGSLITNWYDGENYYNGHGTLGSSCMSDGNYFEIYENNPEVCRMLILVEQSKLKGRALVWKVNHKDFEFYMDRIYTNLDSDVEKFKSWAKKNGWAYRANNFQSDFNKIIFNDEVKTIFLEVKVKPGEYNSYPYMDTFKSYYPEEGKLRNLIEDSGEGAIILQDTDGGYDDIRGLWSEYLGTYIPEEEAIWSNVVDSYLLADSAVYVEVGSRRHRGAYPEGSEDVAYSEYIQKWIHMDDAVWSDYHGDYLLENDAVEVISEVKKDLSVDISYIPEEHLLPRSDVSDLVWYKKLLQKRNLDKLDFNSQTFTENYDDNYIPKSLAIMVNKETLLHEEDAYILDVPSEKNDTKIDLIEYNTILKEKNLFKDIVGQSPRVSEEWVYEASESSTD
jgi:hypothetical protein